MSPPPAQQAVMSDMGGMVAERGLRPSLPEAFRSIAIPAAGGKYWRKLAAFAGPGYLVAVGYMDPGNWATDIAGGSRFGYSLLSVVLLSSFVAMFLQWLSLRLGIASGRDLAQLCRERFGQRVSFFLWITCEIAIAACDLAEVIGTAIALKLLFHLPLLVGVAITIVDTLVIMALQKRGFRYVEALVITLVGAIGACFAIELFFAKPELHGVLGGFAPTTSLLRNPAMLYIALGIFGATVMPHNLYLHSSIAQTRSFDPTPKGKREAIHFTAIDCFVALGFALFVNAAILILAAASFHATGHSGVAEIADAYKLLSPVLGTALASVLFAAALLASGQSSTLTGTMAGQIVMEGFLGLRMNPAVRRLMTRAIAVVPAFLVIAIMGESSANKLLILSQVILSLQLGFAVIPLVMFTGDKAIMGSFANSRLVSATAYGLGALIVGVNGWLIVQTFVG
jgi:manganese transport protein